MTDIINELIAEIQRAGSLHPDHHSLCESLGVINCELHEVMEAVHQKDWEHSEVELIQVASSCLRGVIASRNRRAEVDSLPGWNITTPDLISLYEDAMKIDPYAKEEQDE